MANNDDSGNDDEKQLFRQAMADVTPLKQERIAPARQKHPPEPIQLRLDESRVLEELLTHDWDETELDAGEQLSYVRPGFQQRELRKLKRGMYSVAADLDLHGYTWAEAAQALSTFIRACRDQHIHCVRIIHGKGYHSPKGKPVLKTRINQWLRHRDDVLAFCSAPGHDGGTGAIYVLFSRRKT